MNASLVNETIRKTYSYTYYPNGLKKTYTNPEGITYTYYYNKNNQLMAVHIPGEGQISWTEFSWMVPQTLLLPGGQKISLRYDDFQQVKERALTTADDTELASAVYEYDLEQNIKKIEKGEGVFNYGYDDLYRLTSADAPEGYAANDETFGYDGVGNRTTHTENGTSANQSYNQKNQLQTISTTTGEEIATETTYTYNASGHTKAQTKNGVVTEYSYNHEERLIEVKRDGQTLAEYAYNPHGQRIKKTANGITTWYFYNENGLAAEYASTGHLIKEYHFHPQKTWMTDPLFQRTADGDVYYYHNDHLGTPQQLVDASGNVVWVAQYSAFGKAYVTVNTVENNLRFPGQYFDVNTELHYNYFRDYHPAIGRYLQSDPIGLNGGINTYAYVEGNPIMKKDYFGLFSSSDCYTAPGQGGFAPATICRPGKGINWNTGEYAAKLPHYTPPSTKTIEEIECSLCNLNCSMTTLLLPGPIIPMSKKELAEFAGWNAAAFGICHMVCKEKCEKKDQCHSGN